MYQEDWLGSRTELRAALPEEKEVEGDSEEDDAAADEGVPEVFGIGVVEQDGGSGHEKGRDNRISPDVICVCFRQLAAVIEDSG